jgi:hypothetical protein
MWLFLFFKSPLPDQRQGRSPGAKGGQGLGRVLHGGLENTLFSIKFAGKHAKM